MAAIMKARARHSKQVRHPYRSRKHPVPGSVGRVHWIGQMVVGVAPRAWSLEAANDPQA